MEPKDWTLLVLASSGGRAVQPVQLQKALFLIGRQIVPAEIGSDFYQFSPYDYGPFCGAVYNDAEALEKEGLAIITTEPGRGYRLYGATPAGAEQAAQLRAGLSPASIEFLDRLMRWIMPLSFERLVRAIYASYPDMKKNSVFQD